MPRPCTYVLNRLVNYIYKEKIKQNEEWRGNVYTPFPAEAITPTLCLSSLGNPERSLPDFFEALWMKFDFTSGIEVNSHNIASSTLLINICPRPPSCNWPSLADESRCSKPHGKLKTVFVCHMTCHTAVHSLPVSLCRNALLGLFFLWFTLDTHAACISTFISDASHSYISICTDLLRFQPSQP